ncbi:hypothetical protein A9P82_11510 [Arachidicoccus ginsenosidimutans]|uniref:CPBP family intramembrane glutamic endopeptidase n=1 Tax=Arachidicoccus sp. BS20 TaxID=1850526 RepID=UPI0007F0B32D|nr:type II CAAX endopeptidase family protein [Arachidicoccus sp. BS20]ANI89858.1 hypothetical protein A9P82_11510 [Arachidicoccus sp. BS20]
MKNTVSKTTYLSGILSILILLLVSLFYRRLFGLPAIINESIFIWSRIFIWLVVLFAYFYAVKIEKQSLIIWEEKKYSFLKTVVHILAIYGVVILAGIVVAILQKLFKFQTKSARLETILNLFRPRYWLALLTCLTAGITEELIFRGYIQTRLMKLANNVWFGIIISAFLFALFHLSYGTVGEFVGVFFIGIIFAYYYWKYRSLKTLMIVHFIVDTVSITLQLYHHK